MKKKLFALCVLFALCILALSLGGCGIADARESVGLYFVPSENVPGTCSLAGIGSFEGTSLVVPRRSPAGDTVTAVDAYAFSGNTDIVSVWLPDTVKTIRLCAFEGCSSLETVRFGAELEEIEEMAFADCTALADFTAGGISFLCQSPYLSLSPDLYELTYHLQISETSESLDVKQRLLHLPNTLRIIGEGAFRGCRSLDGLLLLHDGIDEIGHLAFYGCKSLPFAYIASGISSVGSRVFGSVEDIFIGVGASRVPEGWSEDWCRRTGVIENNYRVGLSAEAYLKYLASAGYLNIFGV